MADSCGNEGLLAQIPVKERAGDPQSGPEQKVNTVEIGTMETNEWAAMN